MTFRLTTLLYLFAVVAASIAALGVWGVLVGLYIFAAWLWLRREPYWLSTGRGKFECLLLFVILPLLIYPALNPARDTGGRYNPGLYHQKQLALAIHNYREEHGHFPPPYVADDYGKPLYSWRVLILPYMYGQPIASQFHYDEPWDSAHNLSLLSFHLEIYQSHDATLPDETQFLAVVDDDTMWNPDREITTDDVTDGLDKTLLLVEVPSQGIHWSEPRDLSRAEAIKLLKEASRRGPLAGRPRHVALADGTVHAVPQDLNESDVEALLTIGGGETTRSFDPPFEWRESLLEREGTPFAIPFLIAIILLPFNRRLGIFPRRDEGNI